MYARGKTSGREESHAIATRTGRRIDDRSEVVFVDNRFRIPGVAKVDANRSINTDALVASGAQVLQRAPLDQAKLNVAGESHSTSAAGGRRTLEKLYTRQTSGVADYWREKDFEFQQGTKQIKGDPDDLILEFRITNVLRLIHERKDNIAPHINVIITKIEMAKRSIETQPSHIAHIAIEERDQVKARLANAVNKLLGKAKDIRDHPGRANSKVNFLLQYINTLNELYKPYAKFHQGGVNLDQSQGEYTGSRMDRSIAMFQAAANSPNRRGVWKIGDNHTIDISTVLAGTGKFRGTYIEEKTRFNSKVKLLSKREFVAGIDTWLNSLPSAIRQSLVENKGVASMAELPHPVKDYFGI